jgi:thiamine-phosphate pyrophosphorylase
MTAERKPTMNGRQLVNALIREGGVYCLTGEAFSLGRSSVEVMRGALEGGARIVQYREKHKPKREKYRECLELRELTRACGAAFIVNDDVDLALAVEADGVHVGQEDLPVPVVRRLVGESMAIGLSTQTRAQALEAAALGADHIGAGPIFDARSTKADAAEPVGLDFLRWASAEIPLPLVAIGGIKLGNVAEVARAGGRCVALVSEVVGAPDVAGRVRELIAAMRA